MIDTDTKYDREVAQLKAKDIAIDNQVAQNKADADSKDKATNIRIDNTNTVVATNDQASKDRDTQLQAQVTANKADADAKNTCLLYTSDAADE